MAFTAPTLTTALTASGYAAELNANLSSIQTAFNTLQSVLNSTSAAAVTNPLQGSASFNQLAKLSQSGGVLGNDAFKLSLNTDTDGNDMYAYISHPDTLTADSAAIITSTSINDTGLQPRWYLSSEAQNLSLTAAVAGLGDGTYNLCIGLKGEGVPNVSYRVAQCDSSLTDTNYEESGIDLPLYTLDYVVSGSTYNAKNIRRACDVLVSHDSFQKAYADEHSVSVIMDDPLPSHTAAGGGYTDSMNTDGFIATSGGLIVPWDCELIRAYVNVDSVGSAINVDSDGTDAPATDTSGWEFTLYRGNFPEITPLGGGTAFGNTMEQVVEGPVFLTHDSSTVALRGFTQPAQLAAGTFIQPAIGIYGDPNRVLGTDAEPPTGMSITVVIRRHYEGIYT